MARADTSAITTRGEFAGGDRFGIPGGDGPYPLGRESRIAIRRTRAYVALADSAEILVFDLNGRKLSSLNARAPRVLATKVDLEAARERKIATMGEKARRSIERSYAAMPLARYLPGTRDLVVEADDNLWVQQFPRSGQPNVTWTVFGNYGRLRATIALSVELEVYEIGR